VTSAAYFNFLFLACWPQGSVSFDVTANYHLTNPGGEELSSGEIPLKTATVGFAAAWAAIAALVLLAMAHSKVFWAPPAEWQAAALSAQVDPSINNPVRPVHWLLLGVPLLHMGAAAMDWYYWNTISRTGVWEVGLELTSDGATQVAAGGLLGLLLLLSRGWQITRQRLAPVEMRQIVGLLMAYVVAWSAYNFVGGYFLLFVVVFVVMLCIRVIFATLALNMHMLHAFRVYVARTVQDVPPAGDPRAAAAAAARRSAAGGAPEEDIYRSMEDEAGGAAGDGGGGPEYTYDGSGNVVVSSTGGHRGNGERSAPASAQQQHADHDDGTTHEEADTAPLVERAGAEAGEPAGRANRMRTWWRSVATAGPLGGVASGRGGAPGSGQLTLRQLVALRWFRTAIVAYLSLSLVLQVYAMLSTSHTPWATYVVEQVLACSTVLYVCTLFRPRADPSLSPLYDPRGYFASAGPDRLLLGPGQGEGTPSSGGRGRPGYGAAGGSGSNGGLDPSHIVIVNPDTFDASGKRVRNVGIGEDTGGPYTMALPRQARGGAIGDAVGSEDNEAGHEGAHGAVDSGLGRATTAGNHSGGAGGAEGRVVEIQLMPLRSGARAAGEGGTAASANVPRPGGTDGGVI
jgi:hypothetical protein